MTWIEANANTPITTGAQHGETLLDVPTRPHLIRATITRILLSFYMDPGLEAIGDASRLDYGIALLSSDAVAAAALPDPEGPDSGMWLMRDMRVLAVHSTTFDQRQLVLMQYDLKSQRVLRQDQTLQLVLKDLPLVGTIAWTLRMMSRVLVKLP